MITDRVTGGTPVVRFTLLGPVRATSGSTELALGTPQQQALLALLLIRDAPVPVDDVVDALWGEHPPRSARSAVRTYAARLRQVLGDAVVLQHSAAGYRLARGAAQLDLAEFTTLLDLGRSRLRTGDPAAATTLHQALDLWTGPALAGVPGVFAEGQRVRLEALRRTASEQWFEAELSAGRHESVVAGLGAAVAERPLNARLTGMWMTALHRDGRAPEALDAYRAFRTAYQRDLGLEPGAELQALHQRILRGEAATAAPAAAVRVVPDQLPTAAADFTGRDAEQTWLHRALTGDSPVVGLTGLGGSGKTALAVQVARLVAHRFPDGRLFVDLAARSGAPVTPSDVLGRLLRAVAPGLEVPATLDERAALWRTTVAGRRLILVLDDAGSGAQVTPLLPGTPHCAVVITSTRRLRDLPAVRWRRLGPLRPAEALHLLGEIAGHERVAREPGIAADLVAVCSYQPLAVRVAADRLLDRPLWTVRQIVDQLDDDLRQPVVMHEDCRIVDEPIRRAESGLLPGTAAVFRLAAVPSGAERTADDVTVMMAWPRAEARAALEDLVDAHLLEASGPETYRYPVLVQAFARRRAAQVDGAQHCRRAVELLQRRSWAAVAA